MKVGVFTFMAARRYRVSTFGQEYRKRVAFRVASVNSS